LDIFLYEIGNLIDGIEGMREKPEEKRKRREKIFNL
jgi:hypothetical protein